MSNINTQNMTGHQFQRKIRKKYTERRIAISAEKIQSLCLETIEEFCQDECISVDVNRVEKRTNLWEQMCSIYGDRIIQNVINEYFFTKQDTWKDDLKDIVSDTVYHNHWRHFLVTFKSKVRNEIDNVKKLTVNEFKGVFPDQLEYRVVETCIENVGDCYYKEHRDTFFLRYYFKLDTDTFVIGIKITEQYCQIIQYDNNDQTYKSMKLSPIGTSKDDMNVPLLCSLTYNEWDSDTNKFINHGVNVSNDISVIHYTTICRIPVDSEEYVLGFNLYNMYISLGTNSDEMQDELNDLIKKVLNNSDLAYKEDPTSVLTLRFNQTKNGGFELSGLYRYCNNVRESQTFNSKDFDDVFNIVRNKTGGIAKYLAESFFNFFEVIWFCGDCTLLISKLNISITRDNTTNYKCFTSVVQRPHNIQSNHIQDIFNILLFDVPPCINLTCNSSPYSVESQYLKSLNESLPSYIKNTHFKEYLKKFYNGRMKLSKQMVDSLEVGLVYLSNILIINDYPISFFIKCLYEIFPPGLYQSPAKITPEVDPLHESMVKPNNKRGRPRKNTDNNTRSTKKMKMSPEETIAARLKSSNQRSCTMTPRVPELPPTGEYVTRTGEYVPTDREYVPTDSIDMEDSNVKTRLIMDSETDGCIQWNEKVSVQLPDSIRNELRKDVLQRFEVNLKPKLKKRIVHDFLQELFNSDKWKDSELKKSLDFEYKRRKETGGNHYGGLDSIGPMYQLVMKSCGFPIYSPPSTPTGIAYYLVEKEV